MRQKIGWVVILGLAIGLIFIGCAPAGPAQPAGPAEEPQEEIIKLVWRQNDPPNQVGEGLNKAVAVWNERHPTVQVTLETVPWSDAQEQYVREVQTGGGPDVVHLAFVWTRDLAKNGLVLNLDPYLEKSPWGPDLEDFLGVDLGVYNDSIYGVPWSVDTFAMAYRPDLFEEAGVESFPETWDDLVVAAAALTADKDGDGRTDQYGFCFPAGSGSTSGMWFLVNYYLWSHGHSFIRQTESGEFELGLTADDIVEAMEYFDNFFKSGYTPETMIGIDSWGDPEYTGSLGRGDCTIIFVPPSAFRAAQAQSEVPLRTAPDPKGPAGRISHLGGRTLAINPNSKHPDEAFEFLTFLMSKEFYQNYYTSYFPAQKSLLAELEFGEDMQGYAEQLPHAITFSTYILAPPPVSAMWEATNREFGAVYSGQKTPEEAAATLFQTMATLLETSG